MPGEDRTYAGEFQDEAPPRAATTYLKQLSESFKTGRYSDLTISCGGRQWKVHSFQLSHQSEVFDRMLHGAFKEGGARIVPLENDDPDAMSLLLRYFYKFTYEPKPHSTGQQSPLVVHFRVAMTADKYMVLTLINLASDRFRKDCGTYWCLPEFVDAIQEIYSYDGGERFRREVLRVACQHLPVLSVDRTAHRDFWSAAKHTPHFAAALLLDASPLLAPEHDNGDLVRRYRCPVCNGIFRGNMAEGDFSHICGRAGCWCKMTVAMWEDSAVDA